MESDSTPNWGLKEQAIGLWLHVADSTIHNDTIFLLLTQRIKAGFWYPTIWQKNSLIIFPCYDKGECKNSFNEKLQTCTWHHIYKGFEV